MHRKEKNPQKSQVIPVYKSGNRSIVSNYHPISTLMTINKIFEKLTHCRIMKFIENQDGLDTILSNYRPVNKLALYFTTN